MTEKPIIVLLNPPSRQGTKVVRDTFYGCWCKGRANYNWPPTALAVVGATLKEVGEVKLIDAMGLGFDFDKIVQDVAALKPKYVCVSTATITFSSDVDCIKEIKKRYPDLNVIFFGTHVTTMPKPTLQEHAIDYIVLGDPDLALRNLIVELEQGGKNLNKVIGIGYRTPEGEIKTTGRAPPIENLDALPFADLSLIPNAEYFNPLAKRLPYTTMLSSRGCPALCTYCTAVVLHGKVYRAMSAKRLVDEIERNVKEYGIREIFFRDETFTFSKRRTLEICKELINRNIDITWIVNARVNTVDDEMLGWMAKTGCHLIKFGVESGSQQILNNIKKGQTLDQIRTTFALCKKHKIDTVAHIMMGNPGETEETIQQTINFVLEIDPTYASFNITTPYPGTELWDLVKDKLKLKQDFSAYDIEKTLETANFSELICGLPSHVITSYFDQAYRKFYFRPGYILKRLLKQSTLRDVVRLTRAGGALVGFTIKNMRSRGKDEIAELIPESELLDVEKAEA